MITNWGVRARVMLAAVLPMLVLAVIMTTVFTALRLADLNDTLGARGRALARQIAATSELATFAGDRGALRQIASAATGMDDVLAVRIFDRNGTLLAASGETDTAAILPTLLPSASQLPDRALLRFAEPIRPPAI